MLPRWRTARLAPVLLVALAAPPVAWGADAGLDARVGQEAGEVHLEGTVRTYKAEVLDNAPATVNDPELARRVQPLLERIVGAGNVKLVEPSMAGEDFAYFANQAPGFFYRLGVVAPGTTSGGLHTPTFRANDSAVPVGIRVMSRLLADFLSSYGNHSPR